MKISIKELIDSIIDIADTNLEHIVRTQYVMSLEGIDIRKAKDWPAIFILLDTPAQLLENTNAIPISFYFLDAAIARKDQVISDLEIKSDLMQSASKLFDLLEVNGIKFQALAESLTPITADFNDGLSGWSVTATFNIAKPCYEV